LFYKTLPNFILERASDKFTYEDPTGKYVQV